MVLGTGGLTETVRQTLVRVQVRDGVHPDVRDWRAVPETTVRESGRQAVALVFGEGVSNNLAVTPTPEQLVLADIQRLYN